MCDEPKLDDYQLKQLQKQQLMQLKQMRHRLETAAKNGDLEEVKGLIAATNGGVVRQRSRALEYAIKGRHVEVVRALVDAGVDVFTPEYNTRAMYAQIPGQPKPRPRVAVDTAMSTGEIPGENKIARILHILLTAEGWGMNDPVARGVRTIHGVEGIANWTTEFDENTWEYLFDAADEARMEIVSTPEFEALTHGPDNRDHN